jgi:hypothetical protein
MTSVATREASPVSRALLPEPGLYRHFKGGEYEVLEVARHSETEELLVIYCSLDDPTKIWCGRWTCSVVPSTAQKDPRRGLS